MSKFPSEMADRFQVRLPDGLRDEIRAAAKANGRSMNAEIVSRLQGGETLRDKFAGQAMAGLLAHTFSDGSGFLHDLGAGAAAYQAYRIADAMLIARQSQEGEDA